jgi:hypothetical protein
MQIKGESCLDTINIIGRKGRITSTGKGTTGCGFLDPSGSKTCNIEKFTGKKADLCKKIGQPREKINKLVTDQQPATYSLRVGISDLRFNEITAS